MLISLTVKNWMSFKDETRWLLAASKERIHRDRLPKKRRLAISPIAAIFGPNGSGKTNLIHAIDLMQRMVLGDDRTSNVIPYVFDHNNEPTTIRLEMLINDRIYSYTVSMTQEHIISEELSEIISEKSICLFRRDVTSHFNQKYQFPHLKCDEKIKKLSLIGESTKANRLFLRVCAVKSSLNTSFLNQRIVSEYDDIIEWFRLLFVQPLNLSRKYQSWVYDRSYKDICKKLSNWLHDLDTGIIKIDINNNLLKHIDAICRDDSGGEVVLSKDLLSTGTIELIHFLALIVEAREKKIVLVIDEFGQNFHNDLFNAVVELFLIHCGPKTRSQLIFTTQNQSVMTQSLLRLDEMWVVEKHGNKSTLHSFVEFEGLSARTDVAKRYRQGHLGGLPTLCQPQP